MTGIQGKSHNTPTQSHRLWNVCLEMLQSCPLLWGESRVLSGLPRAHGWFQEAFHNNLMLMCSFLKARPVTTGRGERGMCAGLWSGPGCSTGLAIMGWSPSIQSRLGCCWLRWLEIRLTLSGRKVFQILAFFLNFNFPKNTFKYSKSHSQDTYRKIKPVKYHLF